MHRRVQSVILYLLCLVTTAILILWSRRNAELDWAIASLHSSMIMFVSNLIRYRQHCSGRRRYQPLKWCWGWLHCYIRSWTSYNRICTNVGRTLDQTLTLIRPADKYQMFFCPIGVNMSTRIAFLSTYWWLPAD